MKFSATPRSARETKRVQLPRPHAADLPPVWLLLRPLSAGEEVDALVQAREFAEQRKANPVVGDPVFDRGLMVATILRGCFDEDSPAEKREPFFASAEEIVHPETGLSQDELVMLFELHEIFQDSVSVSIRRMSSEDLVAKCIQFAEAEDDRPFVELSPALRVICMRTMARRLRDSLGSRSSPGSPAPRSTGATRRGGRKKRASK